MIDPIAQKILDRQKKRLAEMKAKKENASGDVALESTPQTIPAEENEPLDDIFIAKDPSKMASETVVAGRGEF